MKNIKPVRATFPLAASLLAVLLLVTVLGIASAQPAEHSPLAPAAPAVAINELRIDEPSTDNDEYFELIGAPTTVLDGLTYIVLGDSTAGVSGVVEAVVDLTGSAIPADGIFLAVESTFTLGGSPDLTAGTALNFENGDNVTHMLVENFTGALSDDLDTNDDGVLDVTPWTGVVDCIAVLQAVGLGEQVYCPATVGPDGDFAPSQVARCPNGLGAWAIGTYELTGLDTPGAPNACVSVTKSVDPADSVAFHGTLTYTIEVAGTGLADLSGLLLTDTLPASVDFGDWVSQPAGAAEQDDEITWTGSITDSETVALSFTAEHVGIFDEQVVNTVTVDYAGFPYSAEAAVAVPPILINELDSDTVGTDALEFVELYDGGVGNTPLDDLVVVFYNGSADTSYAAYDLDAYVTGPDGYFVLGNAAIASAEIVFANNFLQNGQDAVALYQGSATDFPLGTLVTTANLLDANVYDTDDADDPGLLILLNPGQPQLNENAALNKDYDSLQRCPNGVGGARNTDTYLLNLPTPGADNDCRPDLAVDKSGPSVAFPGAVVTYTISYGNVGVVPAADVVLADLLPDGATYLSDDSGLDCPGCTVGATGLLTWTVGPLAVDGNSSFSLQATFTDTLMQSAVLTNTATITASNGDADPTTNSSDWVTTITDVDLALDKDAPSDAITGDELVYTLQLDVSGVVAAANVVLTDTLPVTVTYVSDDSGVEPSNPAGNTIVWDLGDLPSGTSLTIHVTTLIDQAASDGTVLLNTAEATTDATGDLAGNNTAQASTTVHELVSIYDIQHVNDPTTSDASLYNGQMVWTEGVVTAEPGELGGAVLVIEDPAGGPWSGLYVYRGSSAFQDLVAPEGTTLRLYGQVYEYFNLTEFQLNVPGALVEVVSTGDPLPAPAFIDTGHFTTAETAEQWESVLIEFRDAAVTDPDLGYGEWAFDDGTGATGADDVGRADGDLTYIPAADDIYSYIRGIGTYAFSAYKLLPRYDADVGLQADAPNIWKDAPRYIGTGERMTYTLTVENLMDTDLTGLVITDSLPAGTELAAVLDGGSETGGLVTWSAGDLLQTESVSVRFVVTATATGGQIWNQDYGCFAFNYLDSTRGDPVMTEIGDYTPIYSIQGSGMESPYDNLMATTVGVVIGVFEGNGSPSGNFDGFFIQDLTGDTDTDTSDGIYVNTGSATVALSVGDVVTITGLVQEFDEYDGAACVGDPCLTQIRVYDTADIEIGGTALVPLAVELNPPGDTAAGLAYKEALEGMMVTFPSTATVVGPTNYNTVMVIRGDLGIDRAIRTGPYAGMPIGVRTYELYGEMNGGDAPNLNVGSVIDNASGPLGFSYGAYLVVTQLGDPWVAVSSTPLPDPAPSWPAPLGGEFSVASFNTLNFDAGASALKFDKVITTVHTLGGPTFLSLEEIDVDGVITDVINALAGIGYPYDYAFSHPDSRGYGVAVLWRTDLVSDVVWSGGYQGCSVWGSADATSDPLWATCQATGEYPLFARPPVVVTGTVSYAGDDMQVVVIGNHLKSKLGGVASDYQRLDQATFLGELVDQFVAQNMENIVLLGDLNDFEDSAPLQALTASGNLENLFLDLPEEARYSYIYGGVSEVLDHVLVTPALHRWLQAFSPVHVNVDYAYIYSTQPGVWSTSDHEPLAATFTIPRRLFLPLVHK